MKIFNFNKNDHGSYICIATNKIASKQDSIYLGDEYDVGFEAHIDVKSEFNGTVSLTCNASKLFKLIKTIWQLKI
jgi:hypothetical protein